MSVERLLWASYGFTFSQNLKEIRRRRAVTQQALAEIAGMSRTQICNLERNENNSGTSADPALSTVYKLALALEVPPSLLLPESGQVVASICTTPRTRTALMRIKKKQSMEAARTTAASIYIDGDPPQDGIGESTAMLPGEANMDVSVGGVGLSEVEEPLIMTIEDLAPFPRDYTESKRREAKRERAKKPSKSA